MTNPPKGKSPFYPGQPVPVELFVGRAAQIRRIVERGVGQAAAGKPVAMYVQGEYGIGKSSIAAYAQRIAEADHGLHAVYASLGGAEDLNGVAAAILEGTVRSGAFDPKRAEKIRNWLAKYVGHQELFGFSLNLDALRRDAPNFSTPLGALSFFQDARSRLKDQGVKGIFVVLDEINGITDNPKFSNFIKGLVDTNAMSKTPLPMLLMLCGVEERRREMIRQHQPIDRIFDVVDIEPMTVIEMESFYRQAFQSVQVEVDPDAIEVMTKYAAGFPKIMHLIGDAAFWSDQDGLIDKSDALGAVVMAAEDVGKKYVDQQVFRALRSPDYHSILAKIAKLHGPIELSFRKSEAEAVLTDVERGKLSNFLQKMKKLNVIRSGDVPGEYVFNIRMVLLYIWMETDRKHGAS